MKKHFCHFFASVEPLRQQHAADPASTPLNQGLIGLSCDNLLTRSWLIESNPFNTAPEVNPC